VSAFGALSEKSHKLKSRQNNISNGPEVLRISGISKLVCYEEEQKFELDAAYIETETILPKASVFSLNQQMLLLMNSQFSNNKDFIRVRKEGLKVKERVKIAHSV